MYKTLYAKGIHAAIVRDSKDKRIFGRVKFYTPTKSSRARIARLLFADRKNVIRLYNKKLMYEKGK